MPLTPPPIDNAIIQMRFDNDSFVDVTGHTTWGKADGYDLDVSYSNDTPFPDKGYKSVNVPVGAVYDCKTSTIGTVELPSPVDDDQTNAEFVMAFWEWRDYGSYSTYGYNYTGDAPNFPKFAYTNQGGSGGHNVVFIGGILSRANTVISGKLIENTFRSVSSPDTVLHKWRHFLINYKAGKFQNYMNGKLVTQHQITKTDSFSIGPYTIPLLKPDGHSTFFFPKISDGHHYYGGKLFDFVIIRKAMDIPDNCQRINVPRNYIDQRYLTRGFIYTGESNDYLKLY